MFIIFVTFGGGPLGLILLAAAAFGCWKTPKENRGNWIAVCTTLGLILVVAAIAAYVTLANINFAL
jgi:hypothetical protein